MPMDRNEFRAMQHKLQMTNYARHLKQADRAAQHCGVTVAGIVLIFLPRRRRRSALLRRALGG